MPTWKERLLEVRELRSQRKKRDAELYTLQIQDTKRRRAAARAARKETRAAEGLARIQQYRRSIAEQEMYLQELAAALRELGGLAEKKAAAQNRLQFLQGQLLSVRENGYDTGREPGKLPVSRPADLRSSLKPKLSKTDREKLLDTLEEQRKQAAETLSSLNKQNDSAGSRQDGINQEKRNAEGKLKRLKEDLAKALKPREQEGTPEAPAADREKAKALLVKSKAVLHSAISGLYNGTSLQEAVQNLSDNIPFLLLPIRLETRIVTSGAAPELWLRVFPDDIAVHTHETVLTDQEVAEGEKYWKSLWGTRSATGATGESKRKSAWTYLAQCFGSQRAAWIAKQTKPANWDTGQVEDQPEFPVHDLTKTSSWSRAPRTNVMPDKFVVMLYEGDTVVKEEEGNLVPDELEVGPDPQDAENSFVTKDGKLVYGESFDWLSDFPKAIKNGMGFRIPITQAQATKGFDKILVLGLSLSMDDTDGQKALEELLDSHHYSPKGLSLIPQGTSTNNSDDGSSGYTSNDPSSTSYNAEAEGPLFKEGDDADGRILADALGVEYETLQNVGHADGRDFVEAVRMNAALFPGTLGYHFATLLDPVLDDSAQNALRSFFVGNVTGRGPLSAIRVGDQPYGILLTSDFGSWQWSEPELASQRGFLGPLFLTLQQYQAIWIELMDKLAHVGKNDANPSQVLMNILGLQAGSVTYRQRIGYSTDYLINLDDFQFGGRYAEDMRKSFTSKSQALTFLKNLGYNEKNPDGSLKVPQLLRLLYQHFDTELDATNLVDNVPLSEKDPIRYYDADAKKNYIDWLSAAQTIEVLEKQDFGAAKPVPNALLYLMLRRALLLQLHRASVGWLYRNGVDLRGTLKAANFSNIRSEPDLSKWEVMKAKVSVASPLHFDRNKMVSEYLLTSGRDQEEAQALTELRQALTELSQLPTARLERCFTEHLDACTYRLDSWQTAMFGVRLKNDRMVISEKGHQRRKGIYLGAYGWVENLRPASKHEVARDTVPAKLLPPGGEPLFEYADNGGFVHAPSLNQASAAAVLRSGYLSHARSTEPDALCVNLTSERIRRALLILAGIRNGQTVEALLGYQFERGLHDAASADGTLIRLNEYIYDFRDKFPLEQHYLRQQGSDDPIQGIPAANVVNGVKLSDATGDVPYGATGSVLAASASEKEVIRKQKDLLSDSLDAVKDILLSESVYQMVQGNFDRASAVVNALKDASIPPEIDIIETPRSSQFTFTNRVTVQFEVLDPDNPSNNPWKPIAMSLRALTEPGLNAWLAKLLGDPKMLFCRVAQLDKDGNEIDSAELNVAQLGLQPIDIVYLVGDEMNTGSGQNGQENRTSASELEQRIAWVFRELKGIDDTATVRIEFLKPTNKETLGRRLPMLKVLKGMITDARPVHARDFDPPSKTSSADQDNLEGYDLPELLGRISAKLAFFQSLLASIQGIPIDASIKDQDNNDQHYFTLETAFAASLEANLSFAELSFTFTDADSATLAAGLSTAASSGIADAFPRVQNANSNARKAGLLDQARNVTRTIASAAAQATKLLGDVTSATEISKKVSLLVSAGKALLGEEFAILTHFTYNNGEDIELANADRSQLLAHAETVLGMTYPAEEWLASVGPVRPRVARWDSILALYELFSGERLSLEPIQLPYRAKDSWLAVEFPEKDPIQTDQPFTILHDTLSITVHGPAFSATSSQSGLLIDDWTELIPTKQETTGIAFNYDQPNAVPPQVLLLAVAPEKKGHWSWDALVGILNNTLLRAKLRAVEPRLLDELDRAELGVLLPAIIADFSQYDLNIALDYRMNLQYVAATAPVQAVHMKTP